MSLTNFPLAILTAGLLASTFGQAEAQSLEEAVHLMLKHEPELRAIDYGSQSSFQDWKIARGGLFPQVTLNGSSGARDRQRSTDGLVNQSASTLWANEIGLSIRQLIFDGGLIANEARATAAFYESQRFLQMSTIESRVVELAEVYFDYLRVTEQLAAARNNISNHKEMRSKLIELERNGGVRADTSLIDGRLSLAENNLYAQELAMENARWRFVRLTGAEPKTLTAPTSLKTADSIDTMDTAQNWDFLAAESALKAAGLKRKSVKGLHTPNVYLDAGASTGEDTLGVRGSDDELRAQLVLSWDLYRGGANHATNERERMQLAKATELLRAADLQREHLLRVHLAEKKSAASSTLALEKYADRLSDVIDDYEEQFRIGQKGLLNILDIRNEHYQATSGLIDSRFQQRTQACRILGLQGQLVERLIGNSIADYVTVGNAKADKWYPRSASQHPSTSDTTNRGASLNSNDRALLAESPAPTPAPAPAPTGPSRSLLSSLFGPQGQSSPAPPAAATKDDSPAVTDRAPQEGGKPPSSRSRIRNLLWFGKRKADSNPEPESQTDAQAKSTTATAASEAPVPRPQAPAKVAEVAQPSPMPEPKPKPKPESQAKAKPTPAVAKSAARVPSPFSNSFLTPAFGPSSHPLAPSLPDSFPEPAGKSEQQPPETRHTDDSKPSTDVETGPKESKAAPARSRLRNLFRRS